MRVGTSRPSTGAPSDQVAHAAALQFLEFVWLGSQQHECQGEVRSGDAGERCRRTSIRMQGSEGAQVVDALLVARKPIHLTSGSKTKTNGQRRRTSKHGRPSANTGGTRIIRLISNGIMYCLTGLAEGCQLESPTESLHPGTVVRPPQWRNDGAPCVTRTYAGGLTSSQLDTLAAGARRGAR